MPKHEVEYSESDSKWHVKHKWSIVERGSSSMYERRRCSICDREEVRYGDIFNWNKFTEWRERDA